jgi:hypothetical protein
MELVSNRHLSSISCMKCRYLGSKYAHFMTANTSVRHESAWGCRFLPTLAGEDKEDEAEIEVGSPEHE